MSVFAPPAVALYILNQKRGALSQLEMRRGGRIYINGDDTLTPPDYRLERIKQLAPAPLPTDVDLVGDVDVDLELDIGRQWCWCLCWWLFFFLCLLFVLFFVFVLLCGFLWCLSGTSYFASSAIFFSIAARSSGVNGRLYEKS